MSVLTELFIVNAAVVERIYSHSTRGVNNLVIFHHDPYMNNGTFGIVKES